MERVKFFSDGRWDYLLLLSRDSAMAAVQALGQRRRRVPPNPVEHRAERAHNLIQMGELSAARRALDGDPVAPGNDATLRALRDPQRRPQAPRGPLAPELTGFPTTSLVQLKQDRLLRNLRSARPGAAGGPSGMTADHVRPLLDSERDAESFCHMCEEFARAQVSDEVVQALRMGRMTALQKSSGGIRGIVVGDFVRRLVARTLAQLLNPAVEQATSPFQFALTTKSGCECVAHIAQALTDLDANATLFSVVGIGAFDLISRSAMLQGLVEVEGGGSVLPFVRLSYGSPSTYWWDDDEGVTHEIVQREGGEQGDPLMPALYALGQHKALVVSERLVPTERLLAFHDDVLVLCDPLRVADVHVAQQALWEHLRIHHGKTQLWNQDGEAPKRVACSHSSSSAG